MCGIAGVFGKAQEDDVRLMIRSIRHRGPDAEGYQNNDCGWLGHCRLSIIDIAGGIQPMSNEDSHVLLAFNGEIYNYNELRQELSELGVTFHTKSDTEVILRGYVYWGEEIVKRLDGMFAFAILDAKKEILLLARDRIGKKPLYWNIDNNTVTFCSELKGIHANPNVHSTVNIDSLRQYFLFDAVQTPNSIVQNIFKVQPATYIIFQTNGNKKEMTYWTPPSIITEPKSFNSIQEELDKRLQKAVQTRLLLADVPVGVFLSGGIDSATIAWYAQQELKNIETFSIGFKEKSYDESADARIVSTALGTRHHEFFVSAKESCDVISKLGELVDEPIADPSIIPTFLLSQMTRRHVTVALSGDGADELLLGYETFFAARIAEIINKVPGAKIALRTLSSILPSQTKYMSTGFLLRRFIKGMNEQPLARDLLWRGSCTPEIVDILVPSTSTSYTLLSTMVEDRKKPTERLGMFDMLTRLYLQQYLGDVVLAKVDRASMAASLEVRSPFLDTAVVELLLATPWRMKLGVRNGKQILRTLMSRRLPERIIKKRKHGFGLPIAQWFRMDLRDLLIDTVSKDRLKKGGFINATAAIKLRDEHLNGTADHRKELWAILVFELWRQSHNFQRN